MYAKNGVYIYIYIYIYFAEVGLLGLTVRLGFKPQDSGIPVVKGSLSYKSAQGFEGVLRLRGLKVWDLGLRGPLGTRGYRA